MVLNASSMQQKTTLCGAPPFSHLVNRTLRHAGDLCGSGRRPLIAVCGYLVEADRVRVDKLVVQPVMLDHEAQHTSEEHRIASGLHGKEQIARPRDRRDSWV